MSNASGRQSGALNPQGLRLEDLARILSALTSWPITADTIQEDIDAGAPLNADGTMNLVQYASWLVREMARGD